VRCQTRVHAAAAGSATLHIALSNIAARTLHVASDDEDDVDEYAAFSSKNASACYRLPVRAIQNFEQNKKKLQNTQS
jgi:hypothetical protein